MRRRGHLKTPPRAGSRADTSDKLTVREYLEFLLPGCTDSDVPQWPPDVFGLVASVLQRSGAYTVVLEGWPPGSKERAGHWVERIRVLGKQWRLAAADGTPFPRQVGIWWKLFLRSGRFPLAELSAHRAACRAGLQLMVAADEASAGVGLPDASVRGTPDWFELEAIGILHSESSLCRQISSTRLVVLPKLHTPQTGMTVRSLSHHLALCPASDLTARWIKMPSRAQSRHALNLLIVPWPHEILPAQFEPTSPPEADFRNLPSTYGCFRFKARPEKPQQFDKWVMSLMDDATRQVGSVDGVIFPESALTQPTHERLRRKILARDSFLIAGVGDTSSQGLDRSANLLTFDIPLYGATASFSPQIQLRQSKHHKWCLDKRQIIQYGLGGRLDSNKLWWEHIHIGPRQLYFVAMQPWLTMSVLICEDLARQDPVGDFVRAVGPNLVVALLMDGPQLGSRWPARYATVLADDPGSSVLTVTSLGMAELSRPPHVNKTSRVVGLWKDAKSGDPVQVILPEDRDGVVVSVAAQFAQEWAADGRDDGGTTGYAVLTGVHYVRSAMGPPRA